MLFGGPPARQEVRGYAPLPPISVPAWEVPSQRAKPARGLTRIDAATRGATARVVSAHSGGSGFCVRACDGFYFPLGAKAQDGRSDAEMCSFVCPGAQMEVYRGRGEDMSLAVGSTGRLYKDLPTAFAYRKASIPACGCQKPGSYAEWAQKLLADPTLKTGDLVVNEQSAALFTGSVRRGAPIRTSQLHDIAGETSKTGGRDADRLLGITFKREIARHSGFEFATARQPMSITVVASRGAAVAESGAARPAAISSAVAKSAAVAVTASAPARVVLSSPFVR